MVQTLMLVYLGCWALTTAVAFVVSRRLADAETSPLQSLGFSIIGGLVWPMLIVGVVEFSSMAAYSSANSLRSEPVPESWRGGGVAAGVVVPLR